MGLDFHHYSSYGRQGGSENVELPVQRVGTQRKGIQITMANVQGVLYLIEMRYPHCSEIHRSHQGIQIWLIITPAEIVVGSKC
jgi:hypothetical protein